ncbi:MAG: Squalene epoxidase [Chaenotheca gracillima]|nr:MAG: Squalene epoxidase [Chaenotheca gracillima]
MASPDVLVIGSGAAGLSSAIAATEAGARKVLLIDKCPREWAGGNGYFTAGAYRTAHDGLSSLLPLVNNVSPETAKLIDIEPYTAAHFGADLNRVTGGRADKDLGRELVEGSAGATQWLKDVGVRFQMSFNRQAYMVDGRYKFWGGLALKVQDGGKGLIEDLMASARRAGVEMWFECAATKLLLDADGSASGVVIKRKNSSGAEEIVTIPTKSIVMAAGGFEANPRLRAQYLGHGWDLAYVRGTPYNTGDGLEMAVRDASAKQAGNWSGCHSVAWDANAPPDSGDREVSNEFTKSGYPLGLMLNTQGERFVDEGVDLRNFTYARFGKAILGQPGGAVFQVWDARTTGWLRDEEYRPEIVARIEAGSIEELAEKCAQRGLENPAAFKQTLKEYNEAVYAHQKEKPDLKWDPAVKDGLSTQSSARSLKLAKSNWALPLDKAPFLAVKVACGITFTFGGLAIDPRDASILSSVTGRGVPGLFCAGEMVGGLFYGNYPGGSGLTAGAVFGRKAGTAAAAAAAKSRSGQRARL